MSDDSDGDGEMSCVCGVSLREREEEKFWDVLAWVQRGGNRSIVLPWL